MAYAKGTATPLRIYRRTNPARVAAGRPIPSTGESIPVRISVARKPAKNKAAK